MWAPGTEPRPSVKAASTLKHQAISQAPRGWGELIRSQTFLLGATWKCGHPFLLLSRSLNVTGNTRAFLKKKKNPLKASKKVGHVNICETEDCREPGANLGYIQHCFKTKTKNQPLQSTEFLTTCHAYLFNVK